MQIRILSTLSIIFIFYLGARAQNLLVNPGAEAAPAGTGWTIISAGNAACVAGSAANTYTNWTMTPDGSGNYPAAHSGTKTFFSGCNAPVPAGPFELRQDIDVSANASLIDAGSVSYTFTGYIQTPLSAQADAGRFIFDYLSAAGVILGASYTSAYQSATGGSGAGWVTYTNTRTAATGTRTVRVRLQTTVATGPAINAYFDDLSVTRTIALPITLNAFTGSLLADRITLNWSVSDAVNFKSFEIQKSDDGLQFDSIGTVKFLGTGRDYRFSDLALGNKATLFYRLRMADLDGRYRMSGILAFYRKSSQAFGIFPNPAQTHVLITGLHQNGTIRIFAMNGVRYYDEAVRSNVQFVDVSRLPKGVYVVNYSSGESVFSQQLILQ